jgi:hypothetical protein
MADTYTAWSNFVDKDGKKIAPGDEVSAAALGVEQEEFDELVIVGAARTMPYPENVPADQSPVDFYKAQMAALAEGDLEGFAEASNFSVVDAEAGRSEVTAPAKEAEAAASEAPATPAPAATKAS